jgi:hypothetical protein
MQKIYIDPSYPVFYEDRLFDEHNSQLNRDDMLSPFIRLRTELAEQGLAVHTADYLIKNAGSELGDYYSLGISNNYSSLTSLKAVNLKAFVVMEPPVVAPHLYRELPALTSVFERVYVHNTEGDGYSLEGVDKSKLRQLFWPQPRADVIEPLWKNKNRKHRLVVINSNLKPVSYSGELYSKRIEAMADLACVNAVDLYGRGWDKWWSRNAMWLPYWRNKSALKSIYKGSCVSKYEVMSKYNFALCFENMAMKGYVTEKIFDCLYSGTVPIYLGAKDIKSLIPENCYIDYRNYSSALHMWEHIQSFSTHEIESIRAAGREFILSQAYKNYYNSILNIVKCHN